MCERIHRYILKIAIYLKNTVMEKIAITPKIEDVNIRNLEFPHILVTSNEKTLTWLQVVFKVKYIVLRTTGHLRALCTAPCHPHLAGAMGRGASDALYPGQGCEMESGWKPLSCCPGRDPSASAAGNSWAGDQDQLLSTGTITALRMKVWPSKSRQAHTF